MAFKFFNISMYDEGSAEAELNSFLQSHSVLTVDRRFVEQGSNSFWVFCVDYVASGARSGKQREKPRERGKDYREILSPEDFTVFAKLRELRKEIGGREGIPLYTIFTNEQLAQIVQSKYRTKADLEKISGVGAARIEKYGPQLIEILSKEPGKNNEEDRKSI